MATARSLRSRRFRRRGTATAKPVAQAHRPLGDPLDGGRDLQRLLDQPVRALDHSRACSAALVAAWPVSSIGRAKSWMPCAV